MEGVFFQDQMMSQRVDRNMKGLKHSDNPDVRRWVALDCQKVSHTVHIYGELNDYEGPSMTFVRGFLVYYYQSMGRVYRGAEDG